MSKHPFGHSKWELMAVLCGKWSIRQRERRVCWWLMCSFSLWINNGLAVEIPFTYISCVCFIHNTAKWAKGANYWCFSIISATLMGTKHSPRQWTRSWLNHLQHFCLFYSASCGPGWFAHCSLAFQLSPNNFLYTFIFHMGNLFTWCYLYFLTLPSPLDLTHSEPRLGLVLSNTP